MFGARARVHRLSEMPPGNRYTVPTFPDVVIAELRDDATLNNEIHLPRNALRRLSVVQEMNGSLVRLSRRLPTGEPPSRKPR